MEAKLVDLDFLGTLDDPVSTLASLEQFLWSKVMNEILRPMFYPHRCQAHPCVSLSQEVSFLLSLL